jgi:hypothetical protein
LFLKLDTSAALLRQHRFDYLDQLDEPARSACCINDPDPTSVHGRAEIATTEIHAFTIQIASSDCHRSLELYSSLTYLFERRYSRFLVFARRIAIKATFYDVVALVPTRFLVSYRHRTSEEGYVPILKTPTHILRYQLITPSLYSNSAILSKNLSCAAGLLLGSRKKIATSLAHVYAERGATDGRAPGHILDVAII